jgi:hypothetical protein
MRRLMAVLRRKLGITSSPTTLTFLSSEPDPAEGFTLGGPSFVCTPEGVEGPFGPSSWGTFVWLPDGGTPWRLPSDDDESPRPPRSDGGARTP